MLEILKILRWVLFSMLLAGCATTVVIEDTTAISKVNSVHSGCSIEVALSHDVKIANGIWLKAYGAKYPDLNEKLGFQFMLQEDSTLLLLGDEIRFADDNSGEVDVSKITHFIKPYCGIEYCKRKVSVFSELTGGNTYGSTVHRLFNTREAANVYAVIFDVPEDLGREFTVHFPNVIANNKNVNIDKIKFKTGDRKLKLSSCSY